MYSTINKIAIICGEYGLTVRKFNSLIDYFDDADTLWAEFKSNDVKDLLGEDYAHLCKLMNDEFFAKLTDDMAKHNVVCVTMFDDEYPETLACIEEPPYVLFCKGDVSLLNSQCLAVIGTRKVSYYGKRVASDFTAKLCEHFTIVSGLAYGVDSVAHETTLENNGKTIAVFGGGILNVYPTSNQQLADKIVSYGGLLISEYGMRAEPKTYHFPYRNRIISGLSRGLLVCQAPLKSGTFGTVNYALDQGKDLFVVPGEIYDSGYSGSNSLIKQMQACCVTNPMDVIDYYGLNSSNYQKHVVELDFDEQKVVSALELGQLAFDQIVAKTGIAPADVNFLLTNLELKSIIVKLPGNFYRLCGGLE